MEHPKPTAHHPKSPRRAPGWRLQAGGAEEERMGPPRVLGPVSPGHWSHSPQQRVALGPVPWADWSPRRFMGRQGVAAPSVYYYYLPGVLVLCVTS